MNAGKENYANANEEKKHYAHSHNDEKEEQGRETHTVDRLKSQYQNEAQHSAHNAKKPQLGKIGNDALVWEDVRKLIAECE